MITRVWSDLESFREVVFSSGLNVVLADRAEDSEETESTNGLGKTTLLRIIHFCLGGDFARDKVLTHPRLANVGFGLDFEFNGQTISVFRTTSAHKHVVVSRSFLDGFAIEAENLDSGRAKVSIEDWRKALSLRLVEGYGEGEAAPTFRELAIYLIRLGKAAFVDPEAAFSNQSGASKRITVSYLLGLNHAGQDALQKLLDERTQVKAAIKALSDVRHTNEKSIGEMEAERVALEAQLAAKRKEVSAFNVREDYRDLQVRLASVDRELHELVNANFTDQRLLSHYKESAAELPEVDSERPVEILKNAGAVFKPEVLRTLDDVATFHSEVHRNRKNFLKSEMARLTAVISDRENQTVTLSGEKSRILGILNSSGALETLVELQSSFTEMTSQLEGLKAKIAERVKFDRRDDELSARLSQERALIKRDLEDRKSSVDEARLLFAEYTTALYGAPGKLSVDVNQSGYSLTFAIDREGSDGVDQMVVFCFDLTVATLRARRSARFNTLIHDSALFADVDPRQYALALRLAASRAEAEGFQYICCLNTGALPSDLGELALQDHVRLRLTDEGEAGRLLGIKLPPREDS